MAAMAEFRGDASRYLVHNHNAKTIEEGLITGRYLKIRSSQVHLSRHRAKRQAPPSRVA
jgi:hypothetical protein